MIALSVADIRARGLKVISSGFAMGQELKLISEKTDEVRNVATFSTGTARVTAGIGWSYISETAYRPNLARYQGMFRPLAQRELRG